MYAVLAVYQKPSSMRNGSGIECFLVATPVARTRWPSSTEDLLGKPQENIGLSEQWLTSFHSIVRASLGAMTTKADVHALLMFLHNEFIAEATEVQLPSLLEPSRETLRLPLREMNPNYNMASVAYLKEP